MNVFVAPDVDFVLPSIFSALSRHALCFFCRLRGSNGVSVFWRSSPPGFHVALGGKNRGSWNLLFYSNIVGAAGGFIVGLVVLSIRAVAAAIRR